MRKEQSNKRTQVVIGVFFISIMITSVIGYLYAGQTDTTKTINGKTFFQTDKGWLLGENGVQYYFSYLPSDVQDLSNDQMKAIAHATILSITTDPADPNPQQIAALQFEVGQTLKSNNVFVETGFTKENKFQSAVITCENATQTVPVLELTTGGKTAITSEGNCVIASAGSPTEFSRLRDALLYSILGII